MLVKVRTNHPELKHIAEEKHVSAGFFPNRHVVYVHSWHLEVVTQVDSFHWISERHNIRKVI